MIEHENPWFRVIREGNWHFVDEQKAANGAAVVAVRAGRLILLEQRRVSQRQAPTLEIPRGYGEAGESAEACALRELAEETGMDGDPASLVLLGHVRPNTALLTSRVALFAVTIPDAADVRAMDGEARRLVTVPLDEVGPWLRDGRIEDGFTLSALALAAAFGLFRP